MIVRPLKSCENDAFVDLHPLQWIKIYKRENKGTKELQIRFGDLCFHIHSELEVVQFATYES